MICIFLASVRVGKSANLLDIGKSEVNVLYIEVTLVYDYQNAYNMIMLSSNLYWEMRPSSRFLAF